MRNVEHYFENLLFHEHDIKGEPNKNALSKEVQDAVEQCVNYIKYTYKSEERKTGKWIHTNGNTFKCSICGNFLDFNGVNAGRGDANYCPNCGEKMEEDE